MSRLFEKMPTESKKEKKPSRFTLPVLLVLIAGLAGWIGFLVQYPLPVWGDEWFTYKTSCMMLIGNTISTVLNDAHPPLYWALTNAFYNCLDIFNLRISGILPFRIISAFYGILAIYFSSLISKRYNNKSPNGKDAQLAFLLIALTSPFLFLFFPMARYYSLFALLVSLSLLLKSKGKFSKLDIVGIIIVDTLMLYTNFLAGLVLIGGWIYLLTRKINKPSRSQLTTMLVAPWILFAPILPSLFSALTKISGQNFFTADFGSGLQGFIVRIVYTWHVFFSGEFIYPWQPSGIVIFLLAGYLAYRFIRYSSPEFKRLIGWAIALPFVLVIISSISLFSLGMEFVPPRLAFAQIIFLIAITLGIFTIRNTKLRCGIIILLLLSNLHADYNLVKRENFLHSTYIIPYGIIANKINDRMQYPDDLILHDDDSFIYGLFFQTDLINRGVDILRNISAVDFSIDDVIEKNPQARIWLVYSTKDRTPDQKLNSILARLNQSDYIKLEHYKYVRESDSALKMKKLLLGREVEKYKKEVILFEPAPQKE
ncbi:hypothetical protein J7L05_02750 [bacterium]|nr:hypothetical protein [bacterium]